MLDAVLHFSEHLMVAEKNTCHTRECMCSRPIHRTTSWKSCDRDPCSRISYKRVGGTSSALIRSYPSTKISERWGSSPRISLQISILTVIRSPLDPQQLSGTSRRYRKPGQDRRRSLRHVPLRPFCREGPWQLSSSASEFRGSLWSGHRNARWARSIAD